MSRIAVYDRYWRTLGGGEQFAGGIAEVLSHDNTVDVLGPERPDLDALYERLGVDLSRCTYRAITDEQSVSAASADYDLFINCTYLSFAPCRAKAGLYVAHFPAPPDPAAAKQRGRRAVVSKALGLLPHAVLPERAKQAKINWAGDALPTAPGLATYTTVVANSSYTQHWLQKLWGVDADVLYPPVHVPNSPGRALDQRDPVILSIGRFVDPTLGHCKKQVELIEAFAELHREPIAADWTLHIVGGCEPANRQYLQKVRLAAVGLPVVIHLNAPGAVRDDLLDRASMYWHAAGLGEDPELHPDRYEHFGISVVEAMGHGLVPLVLDAAGPAEIVRHDIDGIRVDNRSGFASSTASLMAEPIRRNRLALSATERAKMFAVPAFTERLLAQTGRLLR